MVLESIGTIISIILTGVVFVIIAKLVGRIADRFNLTRIHFVIIAVVGFIVLMGLGDKGLWLILGIIILGFGGAGYFYREYIAPVPIKKPDIKPENIDRIDIDNINKIEPKESESPEQVEKAEEKVCPNCGNKIEEEIER